MQCFRATVIRVRTCFPKETEVTNWETVSRVVLILILDLLTRHILGNHFLMETRSELMKQEHQVGSLNNCIDEPRQKAYV